MGDESHRPTLRAAVLAGPGELGVEVVAVPEPGPVRVGMGEPLCRAMNLSDGSLKVLVMP